MNIHIIIVRQVLQQKKQQMDVRFQKNRITKDDPRFQYNVEREFSPVCVQTQMETADLFQNYDGFE